MSKSKKNFVAGSQALQNSAAIGMPVVCIPDTAEFVGKENSEACVFAWRASHERRITSAVIGAANVSPKNNVNEMNSPFDLLDYEVD